MLSFGKFDYEIKKWLRLRRRSAPVRYCNGRDGSLINPRRAGEPPAYRPSVGRVSLQSFVVGALLKQEIWWLARVYPDSEMERVENKRYGNQKSITLFSFPHPFPELWNRTSGASVARVINNKEPTHFNS